MKSKSWEPSGSFAFGNFTSPMRQGPPFVHHAQKVTSLLSSQNEAAVFSYASDLGKPSKRPGNGFGPSFSFERSFDQGLIALSCAKPWSTAPALVKRMK